MIDPNDLGDLMATVLAREIVAAAGPGGVRVLAVTTPTSLIAGLAARELGAPRLALAVGFGRLDGAPRPAVTLGEFGFGLADSLRTPAVDTFAALARGLVGVVVSPAQLDADAATNLSRVGGSDDRPAVALPGSRGLPDNNHAPSRVWYVLARHTPRQLVTVVDFVSGASPPAGTVRRLLTPLGLLDFTAGSGWRLVSTHPGATADEVAAATGFPVFVDDELLQTPGPTDRELAVLSRVDPESLRGLEFLPAAQAAQLAARVSAAEDAAWDSR